MSSNGSVMGGEREPDERHEHIHPEGEKNPNKLLSLVLVRHGESAHNVAAEAYREAGEDPFKVYENWPARDTLLTEHGVSVVKNETSESLDFYLGRWTMVSDDHDDDDDDDDDDGNKSGPSLDNALSPSRVTYWVSPLRRALETAICYVGHLRFTQDPRMGSEATAGEERPKMPTLNVLPALAERMNRHGCNKVCSMRETSEFINEKYREHVEPPSTSVTAPQEEGAPLEHKSVTIHGSARFSGGAKDDECAWMLRETDRDVEYRAACAMDYMWRNNRFEPYHKHRHVVFTHHEIIRGITSVLFKSSGIVDGMDDMGAKQRPNVPVRGTPAIDDPHHQVIHPGGVIEVVFNEANMEWIRENVINNYRGYAHSEDLFGKTWNSLRDAHEIVTHLERMTIEELSKRVVIEGNDALAGKECVEGYSEFMNFVYNPVGDAETDWDTEKYMKRSEIVEFWTRDIRHQNTVGDVVRRAVAKLARFGDFRGALEYVEAFRTSSNLYEMYLQIPRDTVAFVGL